MDGPVIPAGDEEISGAVERQPAGIDERGEEWLHVVVCRDFIQRNGNPLPTWPGKGHEYISVVVHCGIRHGMQIVGDLYPNVHWMWLAFVAIRGHPHGSPGRAFRNPGYQPVFAS